MLVIFFFVGYIKLLVQRVGVIVLRAEKKFSSKKLISQRKPIWLFEITYKQDYIKFIKIDDIYKDDGKECSTLNFSIVRIVNALKALLKYNRGIWIKAYIYLDVRYWRYYRGAFYRS